MLKYWLFLLAAILSEVTATSSLKASAGFTKVIPSVIVVVGYALSFYFLSPALKAIALILAGVIIMNVFSKAVAH